MDSRRAILDAVRRNRPAAPPLPPPVPPSAPEGGLEAAFRRVVEAVGGRVVDAGAQGEQFALRQCYPAAAVIASATPRVHGTRDLTTAADPHQLADLDLFVCEAVLGVAENGAVWLPESRLVHRAAPFITQHLAVLLDRHALVADMAAAYREVAIGEEGYGVFLAGPSKTADIEQSLVIGAHGARSLTVVLR